MRWIAGVISLALIPLFWQNHFILAVLIYFVLMFIPPIQEFIHKYLKLDLVAYAMAAFLIVYGILWICLQKLRRWKGDLGILFFVILQGILKLFKQIDYVDY